MNKRASTQETREALLQWIVKNPVPIEDEYAEHIANGCRYGQPSGRDDFIEDCECEMEVL